MSIDNDMFLEKPTLLERERVKKEITAAYSKVSAAGVFDDTYFSGIKVLFPDENFVFAQGEVHDTEVPGSKLIGNSMLGIDTEYVNMVPKSTLDGFLFEESSDTHFVQGLFGDFRKTPPIPYDEALAHEAGHNVFDRAYKQKYGEFEIQDYDDKEIGWDGKTTDVSDSYKATMTGKLETLFAEVGITLDVGGFKIERRKITEVFAFLIEREYAQHDPDQAAFHRDMNERSERFLQNPEGIFLEANETRGRNLSIEDVYKEPHVLSFLVGYAMDKKGVSFKERMYMFEFETAGFLQAQ